MLLHILCHCSDVSNILCRSLTTATLSSTCSAPLQKRDRSPVAEFFDDHHTFCRKEVGCWPMMSPNRGQNYDTNFCNNKIKKNDTHSFAQPIALINGKAIEVLAACCANRCNQWRSDTVRGRLNMTGPLLSFIVFWLCSLSWVKY